MATLRTYRRRVAPEFGPYLQSIAAAGSSDQIKLVDDTWPVKTTLEVSNLYVDQFLYRPDAVIGADRERVVKTYDPSTGTLFPDKTWAQSPGGEEYELHGLIQPTRLHTLINDALKNLFVVAEFTFTPASNDLHRFDLTTTIAPWLTDHKWVRQVGYLTTGEDREQYNPYSCRVRGRATQIGQTVHLEPTHGFQTTETVYVKALKPAYYHCGGQGVAYGQKTGLTLETDIAPVDEEWLTAAVLVEAWRQLSPLLDEQANRNLVRNRMEAWQWFESERNDHLVIPELTLTPLRGWGPSR